MSIIVKRNRFLAALFIIGAYAVLWSVWRAYDGRSDLVVADGQSYCTVGAAQAFFSRVQFRDRRTQDWMTVRGDYRVSKNAAECSLK